MGLLNPTFVLGIVVVLYLISFIAFALLRIATGISIQRVGYFSLRRIAYTPRDGIRIEIRGLGFAIHRPTFAQPTWLSLRLTEFKVTVDLKALGEGSRSNGIRGAVAKLGTRLGMGGVPENAEISARPTLKRSDSDISRSRTWSRLTRLKNRIKKLHEKIHWLQMVDVEALDSSVVVTGVGSLQVARINISVDTRIKATDRGRLFHHKRSPTGDQRPAEWMFVVKGILYTPDGKDSIELVDVFTLYVHGLLYKDLAGLRDASIALKLGRVYIPYDDFVKSKDDMERLRSHNDQVLRGTEESSHGDNTLDELDVPGRHSASIAQTVSDSQEFVGSILRGIQEIHVAVSFIGMTKKIELAKASELPLNLNLAMNEVGIDMFRLDPKSPAHRMYFFSKDIAHQALFAAISISMSIDDGQSTPHRLLYIPMATTTVKTTLPSKTVAFAEKPDAAERNANILFANVVITSPSLDLDPKHMPAILAFVKARSSRSTSPPAIAYKSHHVISSLLPKTKIKLSIQEPVIRIVLPPNDPKLRDTDEYDLLISLISSISIDIDSSHFSAGELHYALSSTTRLSSHELYYQSADGERHNLLLTKSLELKVDITATPNVSVMAFGDIEALTVRLVRDEISSGLQQIVRQLRSNLDSELVGPTSTAGKPTFLRVLPSWLAHFQLSGSNFGLELAGVDADISHDRRGIALRLESWNAEYKKWNGATAGREQARQEPNDVSTTKDGPSFRITPPATSDGKRSDSTDGRRLAIHVRDFGVFVIEGFDIIEPKSFVALPRFEIAFTTSHDTRGPIFHVNTYIKALYLDYSLYRYYAIGMAAMMLERALFTARKDMHTNRNARPGSATFSTEADRSEMVIVDFKAGLLQVKAQMPENPPMMLHIYGLEAGRHRWALPFAQSRLIRLYAEGPKTKLAWARIVSIKAMRMDLRESRKKQGKIFMDDRSIDVVMEFIRIAVPHQLIFHKISDNVVNVLKATEQLNHRFKTRSNEYILNKNPVAPRKVPKISVRSKTLMFQLEDSAFDWKLGTIYRFGLVEQKQRLAREEAYNLKVKRLKESEQRHDPSRHCTPSTNVQTRGRSKKPQPSETREVSKSAELHGSRRSSSRPTARGRQMRYDPAGVCGMTDTARLTAAEALYRLRRHNAQSWKTRIDSAMHHQTDIMRDIRNIFWGDEENVDLEETEQILAIPNRPGLMTTIISDLHILIDKPSFPIDKYPAFLNRVGKGIPYDMQYSLLVPMNLRIDMGEARVMLRDYPLPLLHVPAISTGQSPRLASWSLKTDFVIAEEFRDSQSIRNAMVQIIPPDKISDKRVKGGFALDVHRTVSPVKTYSDVDIIINTSEPTSITWGTSYQPAIQDMMQIIEGFTKPQVDPSDRTGFWDKIRLSVHSRVCVAWKGDGDVHLKLKGSRDPYVVTGYGAGFVMCWRSDVRWGIHLDNDPKKFMTVDSGEYVLAIPDYSHQARQSSSAPGRTDGSISSTKSHQHSALFKKVVMKLSGNVRWLAGLVFERDLDQGGRSFEFIPHYKVVLKNPNHVQASQIPGYDAYRGFRSQHIHMSIAVAAPLDRDWSVTNLKPSTSYNTVHLSPRFFTHFFDWWALFSGVMSLPVRQGKLFPGIEKSSKKFGRHLATIKYNLLLSPLFIAHVYKHKDADDYSEDAVSATGLKLRIDSFMLDLHQRREQFSSQGTGRFKQLKTSAIRINEAQLDLIAADLRAVSASITGTTAEDMKRATDEDLASYEERSTSVDMSRFTIPDNDFRWIDMDDFVELDWILPAESHPETKIMPLAYAPRFTYLRQTDHNGSTSKNGQTSSAFGHEPTHHCIRARDDDPNEVQRTIYEDRISQINQQIDAHKRLLGEQELRVVRDGFRDAGLNDQFETIKHQVATLDSKKVSLTSIYERLSRRIKRAKSKSKVNGNSNLSAEHNSDSSGSNSDLETGDPETARLGDFVDDFNNRFIIHNVHLKWNNSLRNVILRYVHQVSQRRGFVYYMSRRAVKFILDIVDEQNKKKTANAPSKEDDTSSAKESPSGPGSPQSFDELSVEDRIQELLGDGKRFVDADNTYSPDLLQEVQSEDKFKDIAHDLTPVNSYHIRLIAPQIQLQSEKNPKSVLLVIAKSMQLRVVQIMDKDRMSDDVSGLVLRRFALDMDSVQYFVSNQKALGRYLHLYTGLRYGTPKGSVWPPWVPPEVSFDFELDPFGFSRVARRTSASLQYDKFNTLRLKYNDEVSSGNLGQEHLPDDMENHIDQIRIDFPQMKAICDSTQYYTIYLIVTDLLLYSEPREKVRSERLEKIMLASDFSDLRGAPKIMVSLQQRIRQLEEIKAHFQIHAKYLDRHGWQDRLLVERDLAAYEDELFFMMKAITTSQRKTEDRPQASQTTGVLHWHFSASEIVWHLMRQQNDPLMEFQLRDATYDRTDNSDGSNYNVMEIKRIRGLNLLPDALYPVIIAPYYEKGKVPTGGPDITMFSVNWYMLETIAGISVLDKFEVNLFPLKVQLEREVGKKLFEYIFPGAGSDGGSSSFAHKHIETIKDDEESSDHTEDNGVMDFTESNTSESGETKEPKLRQGSLELRLRPTTTLPANRTRPESSSSYKPKNGLVGSNGESRQFKLFQHSNRPQSKTRPSSVNVASKKASKESLLMSRQGHGASSASLATMNGAVDKPKKSPFQRTMSQNSVNEREKASDDLTQMIARASNYMTLAYVRIPGVVLCLSYKGRGERNIEDVHDFVFRMPDLEYRNKTWSNLDLAIRLKKDVIRALISHTGAIIGNKFSHHRPNKNQLSRLREFANASSLLPNTNFVSNNAFSDSRSFLGRSSFGDNGYSPDRSSISIHSNSVLTRSDSHISSPHISDAPSIVESEAEDNERIPHKVRFTPSSFTRRFTTETLKPRLKDANGDEPEDSNKARRSSVLTLGKKFLGSLN